MRGRRSTTRRQRVFGVLGVAVLATLVLAQGTVPSTTYTSAAVDRGGSVDVVADESGVLGLDVSAGVSWNNNQPEPLVDVTNNLGDVVSVTVSLQDGTVGDLVDPDGDTGNAVTFDVQPGGTRTVEIDTTTSAPWDDFVDFDVTFQGPAVAGSLPDRRVYSSFGGGGYTGPTASFWGFGFGGTCTFNAGSSDPQSRIVSYEWDFDGDGTYDRTTADATTSYDYPSGVTPDPRLRVTDDLGNTDAAQASFLWGPGCS